MSQAEAFQADLDRMNAKLNELNAVMEDEDGAWIDTAKVPDDLLHAYNGLLSYGYANGLL